MADRLSPLEEALKFEIEGKAFFTEAARKSGDSLTKEIYKYLARMETKHMEDIERIAGELKEKGVFPEKATLSEPTKSSSIFLQELKKLKKETILPQDEVSALRNGLALEVRGREMYDRLSVEAKDSREKNFYVLLSGEEQKHFDIIYEFLDFCELKGLRMQE